jgi:hypothetical protein
MPMDSSIPTRDRRLSGRRRAYVLLGLVLALAAAPAVVLASHQFSDVPNTNPFHAQIDALVDSGITGGCSATAYCPKSAVTREQMAAFLTRGLPYTATAYGAGFASEFEEDFIAVVTIPRRAPAGGTAYVEVNASVNVFDGSGTCPCGVFVVAVDMNADVAAPSTTFLVPAMIDGGTAAEGTVNWVFEVPTGSTRQFGVAAFVFPLAVDPEPLEPGTEGISEPEVQGTIVAQYSAFGSSVEVPKVLSVGPNAAEASQRLEALLDR